MIHSVCLVSGLGFNLLQFQFNRNESFVGLTFKFSAFPLLIFVSLVVGVAAIVVMVVVVVEGWSRRLFVRSVLLFSFVVVVNFEKKQANRGKCSATQSTARAANPVVRVEEVWEKSADAPGERCIVGIARRAVGQATLCCEPVWRQKFPFPTLLANMCKSFKSRGRQR